MPPPVTDGRDNGRRGISGEKWGGHDLNFAFVGFGGAGNLRKIGVCHAHKRANFFNTFRSPNY